MIVKEYVPKIKLTIKKISYIILIEIIIFVVFVGYEFINWRKNINELNILTNDLITKSERFTELNKMDKDSDEILKKIDENISKIFKENEYENFLSNLPSKLISFGISNIEIDVSKENSIIENKENYKEIQIFISVSGTISSINNFLKYIENYGKFINISNLSIKASKNENEYGFDISISLPIIKD